MIGGVNYVDKVIKTCEKYSVEDDAWEEFAPLLEERKNAACVLVED